MHFLVFILTKAFTEDNSTSLGKNLLCISLESVFFFQNDDSNGKTKQNKETNKTKQNVLGQCFSKFIGCDTQKKSEQKRP